MQKASKLGVVAVAGGVGKIGQSTIIDKSTIFDEEPAPELMENPPLEVRAQNTHKCQERLRKHFMKYTHEKKVPTKLMEMMDDYCVKVHYIDEYTSMAEKKADVKQRYKAITDY